MNVCMNMSVLKFYIVFVVKLVVSIGIMLFDGQMLCSGLIVNMWVVVSMILLNMSVLIYDVLCFGDMCNNYVIGIVQYVLISVFVINLGMLSGVNGCVEKLVVVIRLVVWRRVSVVLWKNSVVRKLDRKGRMIFCIDECIVGVYG